MIQGVYNAAAAMLSEVLRQDVHVNNLANANTVGFKRHLARVIRSGPERQWVSVSTDVDARPGDLMSTDNPLDVALRSDGYFVLDTGAGRHYTRNGQFTVDHEGFLTNREGFRALGVGGQIHLADGPAKIAEDGCVYSDGTLVDRLLVVDFPEGTVLGRDAGGGVVGDRTPAQVAHVSLVDGAIERSNVNSIQELSVIRRGYRIYEANARVINTVDRGLARLIEASTS